MKSLKPERDDEAHGRRAVEASLRIELVREAERDFAWVDYSSSDGEHGFEMKRVVPSEFMRLQASIQREPFFPSTVLANHWTVLVDAPTNEDLLGSPPPFHDPSPQEVRHWTQRGFHVATASERRQQWQAEQLTRLQSIPTVRGLGAKLEPHLLVLEQFGASSTRSGQQENPRHWEALAAIHRVAGGWICEARPPIEGAGESAGVELAFGFGYARSGPDAFVTRLANWIESEDSKWSNVVESTTNGQWLHRHGVLLFDASDPDYWTAEEQGIDFVPSRAIPLPEPITLWCIFGKVVLRQDVDMTWNVKIIN